MTTKALAVVNELDRYIAEVNRFPTLSAEEEHNLAIRWRDEEDVSAAHALVTANLRFVVAIPLSGMGAIYLDQRIKTGILISQEIVQNLIKLAKHIRERRLEASTPDEMVGIYQQIM